MFGLVPFKGRDVLRRDPWNIDSFFEDFFNEPLFPVFRNERQMKVDIREDEKNYILEAELPGVDKEDISLEVEENTLTISVNHNEEVNEEHKNYIRKERYRSSMVRSFAVNNIIPDQTTAKFENGVLTITLPKKEEKFAHKRRIDIN